MRVLWSNVAALALLVIALVIVLTHLTQLQAFLGTMDDIGPGHSPDEQTRGLVAFGLAVVSILAALKILLSRGDHGTP